MQKTLPEKLKGNYGKVSRLANSLPPENKEIILGILDWTGNQLLKANEIACGLEEEMIATMGKEKYLTWCKNLLSDNDC